MNPDELRKHCAEVGPDDGVDPRDFTRQGSPRVPNRKALQLCHQVLRTLEGALQTLADDALRELHVTSVVPAPNAGRLLVTLSGATDAAAARAHLHRAAGRLRREVATGIHRRRTPELTFRVS